MDFASLFYANVVSIGLIAGGLVAIVFGFRQIGRARRSAQWIPVPAKILRVGIVRKRRLFVPDIWYRYTIDGQDYESNQVTLISVSTNIRSVAEHMVARYQPTQQLIAYVDPTNHKEAILEPGPQDFAGIAVIAIGLLLAASGAAAILERLGLFER